MMQRGFRVAVAVEPVDIGTARQQGVCQVVFSRNDRMVKY